MRYARIGAVFYALWGAMHLGLATALFAKLASGGAGAYVAFVGSRLPAATFEHAWDPVTRGLLWQHAWNLALFGLFALAVAPMNWRNDRLGYRLNLFVVSLADVGFVIAILSHDYIRLAEGLGGPALWLLAAAFTTAGRRATPREAPPLRAVHDRG